MIYAPAFYGDHTYSGYSEFKQEVKNILCDQLVIDIDFLFDKEIFPFVNDIFAPSYLDFYKSNFCPPYVHICSRDVKRVRYVRRILRRHVLEFKRIIKANKKYYLGVIG